jgi:hypothetical protein
MGVKGGVSLTDEMYFFESKNRYCSMMPVLLGQFFMKPSDFYDAPIGKVLHFIRSVGLIKG